LDVRIDHTYVSEKGPRRTRRGPTVCAVCSRFLQRAGRLGAAVIVGVAYLKLDRCVTLDKGPIKTGRTSRRKIWRRPRDRWGDRGTCSKPVGGIVAVGVSGGNIKSLTSAVGQGSIAIAFVRQVLRQ